MHKITCTGTPLEIGYQHGSGARSQVAGSIAFYKSFFNETTHMDWEEVCDTAEKWLEFLKEHLADLVDEMTGIAEGASVRFVDILALNVRTEIAYGLFSDGCTALAYHPKLPSGTPMLAQNWDWRHAQAQNLIELWIEQTAPKPNIAMITEAGIVGKIGLNSNGVGVCLNAIRAAGVSYNRIPVHLALRSILDAPADAAGGEGIRPALDLLERLGVASSAHILLGDATRAIGLETSHVDIVRIEPRSFESSNHSLVLTHTNHYVKRHSGAIEDKDHLPDSRIRLDRINELIAQKSNSIMELKEVEEIFQDEQGYPQSICRDAAGSDSTMTLFSIIMDLKSKQAYVKIGRPTVQGSNILLQPQ